jgi:hypothetical protein
VDREREAEVLGGGGGGGGVCGLWCAEPEETTLHMYTLHVDKIE